jgi:hypothetical protein
VPWILEVMLKKVNAVDIIMWKNTQDLFISLLCGDNVTIQHFHLGLFCSKEKKKGHRFFGPQCQMPYAMMYTPAMLEKNKQ